MKTNHTIRNCGTEFKFICPKTWDSLTPTNVADIRFCSTCKCDVYYSNTDEETIAHAEAGHCIARELPDEAELPVCFLGIPKEPPKSTPQQYEALDWFMREQAIDDSINNANSIRSCPECAFPAPPWRISCRVCGFEFGRVRNDT